VTDDEVSELNRDWDDAATLTPLTGWDVIALGGAAAFASAELVRVIHHAGGNVVAMLTACWTLRYLVPMMFGALSDVSRNRRDRGE
jgi:hypothetical protein